YRPSLITKSLYIQDELHFADDKARITIGARYSWVTQRNYEIFSNDQRLTPRIAFSYNLSDNATAYVLYDCSFSGQPGVDSLKNPFKPMTAVNAEAGFKKDWLHDKLNTTLCIYRLNRNNMITIVPGPGNNEVQIKQTRVQGIEFDMKGEITKSICVIMNYAFSVFRITKNSGAVKESDNVGSAKHIANAWFNYKMAGHWYVSLGYQWKGNRQCHLPAYH